MYDMAQYVSREELVACIDFEGKDIKFQTEYPIPSGKVGSFSPTTKLPASPAGTSSVLFPSLLQIKQHAGLRDSISSHILTTKPR